MNKVLKLQELQEGSEVQTAGWWTVNTNWRNVFI
ncbi:MULTISPECIES: class III lanthipeptide [Bacillus cereus group]|jgi:hypothetical protein|nr:MULTISPECIES: class III lanthipeptide [Bacillus cereus group]MCP1396400.1 hypothetical protein [Bacillus cereus]MED2920349.1 class III lanthipeptide [Bacillus thuringiensis]MED2924476.1 class III lanthipeptide [Bacillus thuringiensis]MED3049677.1 class III lanthipeptide [Bacillus thuringiensis]MED3685958.1 class III lanthipeptide [Bacillus thuringiensis]